MPLLILVVDDEPGIRLVISDYLEFAGYSVISAKNVQEALLMLNTYHPHLLISDIKMPGKNGYELVKQVRQRPEFRLLPVIFLTEHNTTKDRIQGYKVGCDIYLPKPFEMEELGAVIRNLLERSQMIQTEWQFEKKESVVKLTQETPINEQKSLELTEREGQVLYLLTLGLSNIDIAQKLHLSPRTVEKYVTRLFRKSETNNRAELVRFALENHLVK
ncbi:response regulator transcription factor [Gloeocapsa sp. PCC 73106]|uniref:response regulator transcription factor n=1 Tax=Gloeocapsa sp. PCC 73106 TaxID=102232 RepID=UPI0002AC7A92|nr:response regulator transcription factor [Gloeocapsa sp. PCC 73106]ELR99299.1 response regulator containing a CheY-like receiver domain and an HTH DNA-binding domain [Gloeocapsa sp. PCC 73106]